MSTKIPRKFKQLVGITVFSLLTGISSADYFAYVPDISSDEKSKYLHVVNTDYDVLVDSIVLNGDLRDLVLSNKGDFVFVSSVITEGNLSQSAVNVVSTQTNELSATIYIDQEYVRGLTITSDDSTLFVTDTTGVTKIIEPTFKFERSHLETTYAGMATVLSSDDNYLFVVGTDGGNNDGVSVVDVSQGTMSEVATYSLGTGVGVNNIIFDPLYKELYVLNRVAGQLINLSIENYDDANNINIVQNSGNTLRQFPTDSYPVDLTMNADSSELVVAFSYLYDGVGYGDGYISFLDPTDLNGSSNYDLFLSPEKGEFAKDGEGAIHPLSIAYDDRGILHIVKQIWNEYSGTYVTSAYDVTGSRSGIRSIDEVNPVHLGKRASNQATGKFVGVDCSYCPTGLENEIQPVIRPSSLNPFMLLFALIILAGYRIKRNETHHS